MYSECVISSYISKQIDGVILLVNFMGAKSSTIEASNSIVKICDKRQFFHANYDTFGYTVKTKPFWSHLAGL